MNENAPKRKKTQKTELETMTGIEFAAVLRANAITMKDFANDCGKQSHNYTYQLTLRKRVPGRIVDILSKKLGAARLRKELDDVRSAKAARGNLINSKSEGSHE